MCVLFLLGWELLFLSICIFISIQFYLLFVCQERPQVPQDHLDLRILRTSRNIKTVESESLLPGAQENNLWDGDCWGLIGGAGMAAVTVNMWIAWAGQESVYTGAGLGYHYWTIYLLLL